MHRKHGTWHVFLTATLAACLITGTSKADIDWPDAMRRVTEENAKLAQRPGGHDGTYFVICTLYYTPMESGFTAERGFDTTPETRPGLRGHRYGREFLAAIKTEGFGRIVQPVNGRSYIRYNGGNSYVFAKTPVGCGTNVLSPRFSAATRSGAKGFRRGLSLQTTGETVRDVFGSTRWKVVDCGGGLHPWQVDLYWGEDEPLGPGRMIARPKGTLFEYAFSEAKVLK